MEQNNFPIRERFSIAPVVVATLIFLAVASPMVVYLYRSQSQSQQFKHSSKTSQFAPLPSETITKLANAVYYQHIDDLVKLSVRASEASRIDYYQNRVQSVIAETRAVMTDRYGSDNADKVVEEIRMKIRAGN